MNPTKESGDGVNFETVMLMKLTCLFSSIGNPLLCKPSLNWTLASPLLSLRLD